jgi:hypothetical protein
MIDATAFFGSGFPYNSNPKACWPRATGRHWARFLL